MKVTFSKKIVVVFFLVCTSLHRGNSEEQSSSPGNPENESNKTSVSTVGTRQAKNSETKQQAINRQQNGFKQLLKVAEELLKSPVPFIVIETSLIYTRGINSDSAVKRVLTLEKKSSYNFHHFLAQLQDPQKRREITLTIRDSIIPVGEFICSFTVVKTFFPFIKPDSIANYLANKVNSQVFGPFDSVWETMEKSKGKPSCAKLLFCHLNHEYRNENFIQRMIIQAETQRACSVLSANSTAFEPFEVLNEAAKLGGEGHDCETFFYNADSERDRGCVDLMYAKDFNSWQNNNNNNELRSVH